MAATYRKVNVWMRDGFHPLGKPSSCTKHLNKRRARRQHTKLTRLDLAETLEGIKLDAAEQADLDKHYDEDQHAYMDECYDEVYYDELFADQEQARIDKENRDMAWYYEPSWPYDDWDY